MDISFHPPQDREERRSLRAIVPWWRRVGAWFADSKQLVGTIVAAHAITIGVHVWLKGLVTRAEVNVSVAAEVQKATKEALDAVRADLAIIKTNTAGVPEWRGETTKKVVAIEEKISAVEKQSNNNQARIDTYLTRVR